MTLLHDNDDDADADDDVAGRRTVADLTLVSSSITSQEVNLFNSILQASQSPERS